jgi:hydrogenase nickel incorporation protein HypA/HybF
VDKYVKLLTNFKKSSKYYLPSAKRKVQMHELSIAEELLGIIFENAERAGVKKVSEVNLRIGAFSGIMPDALRFAFEVLSQEKMTSGAKLNIEEIKPRLVCQRCQCVLDADESRCPGCGSEEIIAEGGHELQIVSFTGD